MNTQFYIIIGLVFGAPFSLPAILAFADDTQPTADIIYTIKVGKAKHLVHYDVCAGNETIRPHVVVSSPQDSIELTKTKLLPANTCQSYETIIAAKHANLIQVEVRP